MAAAAAYRVEEEQVWKCPKHPTKRRRHGVCPTCLRDRLITLCPNCGNVRPCPCSSASFSSSSSASSSSYAAEPSFTRSRSLAIPFFLRSNPSRLHSASFLSVFKRKGKKGADADGSGGGGGDANSESHDKIEDFARMITRSRSVGVGSSSAASGDGSPSSGKGKFWNMKAFRSSSKNHKAADISALNKG
ncbi:hypothetical protein SASPL_112667 [Salvia splendens]|uniref:Uncharacterized protein n=1 Tax=Salvia splendens TaxID=180675 RepID=A0A8X8YEP6_SALSN|nr:uncharacterized protein LOC121801113 [Salvia splendens]KAG6428416.1 hypothetical protein SASPL_112667 [Salvia splendens]